MTPIKTSTLIGGLAVIAAILLVVCLALTTWSIRQTNQVVAQNKAFITCVTHWADETANRSSLLTDLNRDRQLKIDAVIINFASLQNPKVDRAALRKKFFADLDAFIAASKAYNKALDENPPPESPKLVCPNGKE